MGQTPREKCALFETKVNDAKAGFAIGHRTHMVKMLGLEGQRFL